MDTSTDSGASETALSTMVVFGDIVLIEIPSGEFQMGTPEHEVGRLPSETQHDVTISRPFYIGETPVTKAQFSTWMGYLPDGNENCADDCPVRWVSWHESAQLCSVLSSAAGLDSCYTCTSDTGALVCAPVGSAAACAGYRLPTEAEWEYAARAGSTGAFSNGAGLVAGSEEDCAGDLLLSDGSALDEHAWYCGNSGMWIQPVRGLPPNAWGLFDVSGNVYEWIHDWAGGSYGSDPVTDPEGPETGSMKLHRGGSWGSMPRNLRLGLRTFNDPAAGQAGSGFRLVRRSPAAR